MTAANKQINSISTINFPAYYLYLNPMQLLEKYNQNFKNALAKLNENQLKAVNQIDGPVLVIAGPGTGKTQILAARIGNILLNTDTQPHNILCLTYTDAGAIAMRKRLFEFIGPEAYRVNIYTFHAFCNDIIQENLDYFGKRDLDAVSDLERIEIFEKLIDNFSADHPLKRFRGDVYYEIGRLQSLFSTMKREDWSAEFVLQKIDEYLQIINDCTPGEPYYKTYKYTNKRGDKLPGDFNSEYYKLIEKLTKLRAAVTEYPNYKKLMNQRSRYDFDDMIVWVLDAFKNDEQFLLNYQERYQYILVDEYQDTSGAQNELISLLIAYWDNPNIFVVGDDDQSIFRFQGANIENIESYEKKYEESLYRVMLTDNYRSSQPILDISRILIENNTERIKLPGLSKHLLAKNALFNNIETPPEIIAFETNFHEFAAITQSVETLINKGVEAKEIAVIYKEHKVGEELARYFHLKNIPVNTKRKVDILSEPFGQKVLNILRYIAQEMAFPYSGDELLFEIMHYDFFGIAPMDIAKISVEVNQHNRLGKKEKTSIRKKLFEISNQNAQQDLFEPESSKQIKRLNADIEFWIREAHNLTLQNLFEKIMVRGGILAYVLKSPQKTWLMQMLSSIFNFLKDESKKNTSLKLSTFIDQIDRLEKNGLRLDLNQYIFNEQGVNFLTCHGSKGLEFEYVFFVGCNSKYWEKKKDINSGYKLPDTLFNSVNDAGKEQELRRLFYVALTRAKKHLSISYAKKDHKGKELEHTVFVGEILAGTELQIHNKNVEHHLLDEFFSLQFADEIKPEIGLIDHQYINKLLENYTLSITHLNNYLDCPLKFYFTNLVQVPSGKSESMTFGSAAHYALNKLFLPLQDQPDGAKEFHSVKRFLDDFHWYLNKNREAFTEEEFKRRTAYGDKILPEFYNKYVNTWEKFTLTEYRIQNVEVSGIPIKGVLDKIEFRGRDINVVDYKTGSYDNAKKKFVKPNEKEPSGGDYWRQGVFYKILVENDRRNTWKVVSTEFDFVEPVKDEYKKEKVIITPEDQEFVLNQIKDTYQRIQNHEFTQGCGKEDCHWCNFVKTNFSQTEGLMQEIKNDESF